MIEPPLGSPRSYSGDELELVSGARHWKAYLAQRIRPHLGQRVLEVGAGLGGTTAHLSQGHLGRWRCLEPDPALARVIERAIASGKLPAACSVTTGTLLDLPAAERFDSILYVDVLEHIDDDAAEAALAAERLSPGGKLVVLSPAHQWLYSPFDRAIGHFRRYTRRTLSRAIPAALQPLELTYLDSVGLLASAANRFILKSSSLSAGQVALWDRALVPASRLLDPLIAHSFGKSVFGVWQKR